jgi:pimeloyl-ACP methyl ester carboxylesterase
MEKHANDILRICEIESVGRAAFAGVSVGGYILFEFWRRYRDRVSALALCNTRPQEETWEGRAARLKSAADVLERGTEPFIETMLAKVFGKSTLNNRPDLVNVARRMMQKMTPTAVNLVQRGMAERPDSVATLKSMNVPTLIIGGDEDLASPLADAEVMRRNIPGSELKVIPRAGHYAIFEQPHAVGSLLRQFLDGVSPAS